MLGSTAAGASAAGTVGIMAGTASGVGAVAAVLMAPVTIVVGAATALAVGGLEAACYFQVERVNDPYVVMDVLESVASVDPAVTITQTRNGPVFSIWEDPDRLYEDVDSARHYFVRELYIADGLLKHSEWGFDTDLGAVVLGVVES